MQQTWQHANNMLSRTWKFPDFASAFAFATQAARVFEEHNHHGDLHIGWGKVTITTTTHDKGSKVTEKDFKLAQALDMLT